MARVRLSDISNFLPSTLIQLLIWRKLGLGRVCGRHLVADLLLLDISLGAIGVSRISIWQIAGFYNYGEHWILIALTVGTALIGIVAFGSLAGSMLPFALKALKFDPASASAPFVATLVDVSGIVIYFNIAILFLSGTLL